MYLFYVGTKQRPRAALSSFLYSVRTAMSIGDEDELYISDPEAEAVMDELGRRVRED